MLVISIIIIILINLFHGMWHSAYTHPFTSQWCKLCSTKNFIFYFILDYYFIPGETREAIQGSEDGNLSKADCLQRADT